MPSKKKGKSKKSKKPNKTARKRATPATKQARKRAVTGKSPKRFPKKAAGTRRKATAGKSASSAFSRATSNSRLGEQSGDLQGLSNAENVDSESVNELLEEGNAFEAGVVSGVEDSGDRDEQEVRTREVPEDDVPGEYLDEE